MAFGFRKEELDKTIALTTSSGWDASILLPDNIHPIFNWFHFSKNDKYKTICGTDGKLLTGQAFQQINWWSSVLEYSTWASLKPAFQLATLLLEYSVAFHSKILFAQREDKPKYKIVEGYQANSADIAETRRLIREQIAPHIHFYFLDIAYKNAVGQTSVIPGDLPRHTCIDLAQPYLDFAEHGLSTCTGPERICFFFTFATTLVHEVTHAICQATAPNSDIIYMCSRYRGLAVAEEPYMDSTDPSDELGEAWEQWMFGGLVGDIGGRNHGTADMGVGWKFWPRSSFKLYHLTSVNSLYRMFIHQTWLRGLGQFQYEIRPPIAIMTPLLVGMDEYKSEYDSYLDGRQIKDGQKVQREFQRRQAARRAPKPTPGRQRYSPYEAARPTPGGGATGQWGRSP